MSNDGIRIGIGTRVLFDGQLWEVSELLPAAKGTEVVLSAYGRHSEVVRISLREVLEGQRVRLCGEGAGPNSDDLVDPADVVLSAMTDDERDAIRQRASHIREVLTGFRSGSADFAEPGEPRNEYAPGRSLIARYAAKALELDVCVRTVQNWAADFLAYGEAGLARSTVTRRNPTGRADERWVQTALEVMVEHGEQSRPSQTMVIKRANARVTARFGPGVVALPSRATAYRVLTQLEHRYPLFRLSTKRNRDIARRPGGVYGKLLPTRPGEYLLMDTTRLDVFALDPLTLRWVQAELTVAMDWYTRCIRGRGGPSHRSTLAAERSAVQAPRILKPALIGIGGWERLQRFAKASEYPTLTIAATELRMGQFTLVNQINRIERELGTKLLERAQRGRPMRLNKEGSTVVRAIRAYERKQGSKPKTR